MSRVISIVWFLRGFNCSVQDFCVVYAPYTYLSSPAATIAPHMRIRCRSDEPGMRPGLVSTAYNAYAAQQPPRGFTGWFRMMVALIGANLIVPA